MKNTAVKLLNELSGVEKTPEIHTAIKRVKEVIMLLDAPQKKAMYIEKKKEMDRRGRKR